MPSFRDITAEIGHGWRQVAVERERAVRAADLADRYDRQARGGSESTRPFRTRMAALHRAMAARHLACARLYALHAIRLRCWARDGDPDALRPAFMAAVAMALGVTSASVTLQGAERHGAMVAASDDTARTAHDLEFVLGEGPAGDAVRDLSPVHVTGDELCRRWPQYGPALAEAGVHSVIAAPLRLRTVCIGALCVFDARPTVEHTTKVAADLFADTLTRMVLDEADTAARQDDVSGLSLFHEADYQAVVHQAAGMVSVHCECAIDDALALLRARAFTDGRPIEGVATDVVHHQLLLG